MISKFSCFTVSRFMQPRLRDHKEKHRLGPKKVWLFDKLPTLEHPMYGKIDIGRSFAPSIYQ